MTEEFSSRAADSEPVAPGELESLQSGARWLVGAAAAVLAVLVASVQLSTLAEVAANGPTEMGLALGLSVIALLAVGTILILAARVLTHPGWTLTKLVTKSTDADWPKNWLRNELDDRRALIVPDIPGSGTTGVPPSLDPSVLYGHHSRLLRAWFEIHEKNSTTVVGNLLSDTPLGNQEIYRLDVPSEVSALERRLSVAAHTTAKLVALANLLDVRRRYRRLVAWQLPLLGAATVLAVLGLVWLAADNSEVSVAAPVLVDVKFIGTPEQLANAQLPPTCLDRTIRGTAVNGTLTKPDVSSASDPHCQLNQIEIPADVGIAVPVVPPKQ